MSEDAQVCPAYGQVASRAGGPKTPRRVTPVPGRGEDDLVRVPRVHAARAGAPQLLAGEDRRIVDRGRALGRRDRPEGDERTKAEGHAGHGDGEEATHAHGSIVATRMAESLPDNLVRRSTETVVRQETAIVRDGDRSSS